jgi:hypothetical protein
MFHASCVGRHFCVFWFFAIAAVASIGWVKGQEPAARGIQSGKWTQFG